MTGYRVEKVKKKEEGLPVQDMPVSETVISEKSPRMRQFEKITGETIEHKGARDIVNAGAGFVETQTPNLVGAVKVKGGLAPETVEAPFPLLCKGLESSCGRAFGYGSKVYKVSGHYICSNCGGPLQEIEFR